MDGDGRKSLKIAISEFYKLNIDKGKEYTIKNFKNGGIPRSTMMDWLVKVDKTGNSDIVIKMFKKLKGKVYMANENGLDSPLKV